VEELQRGMIGFSSLVAREVFRVGKLLGDEFGHLGGKLLVKLVRISWQTVAVGWQRYR
jgi:hypothetical protein